MTGAIGIIQARMSSTRLPAKILAPISGQPLLSVMYERVHQAKVDEWWLATSLDSQDDVTAAWGDEIGLRVYRGDIENVLSRFTAIIRMRRPDWILRLTADDPFVDATLLNLMLEQTSNLDHRFSVLGENPSPRKFPLGYVPQVAKASAVLRCEEALKESEFHHRCHVLSWFYEIGEFKEFYPPDDWPLRPQWRWTVDTPADLQMTREAFRVFGGRWKTIGYPAMVELLDHHPQIVNANLHVEQKQIADG
jgi:spore coat polysaccharide biosynthesis protein SpsF